MSTIRINTNVLFPSFELIQQEMQNINILNTRQQRLKPSWSEDVPIAAVQEFARQRPLLERPEKHEPETDVHKPGSNVAESTGFSNCGGVDVNKATRHDDSIRRIWELMFASMTEQLQADKESKQSVRNQREREERWHDRETISKVLGDHPEGETVNQIRLKAGISKGKAERALRAMLDSGEVEIVEVMKRAGNGKRLYSGYRLAATKNEAQHLEEEIANDTADDLDY